MERRTFPLWEVDGFEHAVDLERRGVEVEGLLVEPVGVVTALGRAQEHVDARAQLLAPLGVEGRG